MAITADTFRIGPTYTTALLNFFYRGVTPTPPAAIYYSLGLGTYGDDATEIAGMVRVGVERHRGAYGGNAPGYPGTYPYQSTGTASGYRTLFSPVYLHVPATITTIYPDGVSTYPFLMAYDAPTNGNLVFAARVGSPYIYGGDVIQLHRDALRTNTTIGAASLGAEYSYVHDMVYDWLFRGYDSLSQLYNPVNNPNIYVAAFSSGGAQISPYLAIPRTVGSWSAPAAGPTALSKKITNDITLDFGPLTGSGTTATFKFYLAPPASTTAQLMYAYTATNPLAAVGDTIRFAAGTLEIVGG